MLFSFVVIVVVVAHVVVAAVIIVSRRCWGCCCYCCCYCYTATPKAANETTSKRAPSFVRFCESTAEVWGDRLHLDGLFSIKLYTP